MSFCCDGYCGESQESVLEGFTFRYQPIVRISSIKPVAYEALATPPPDIGIGIGEYIAKLEQQREIAHFDLWVPDAVVRDIFCRKPICGYIPAISVNCSAQTIDAFPDLYIEVVKRVKNQIGTIIVEITETSEPRIDALEYFSVKARYHGIIVALDDCDEDHVFRLPYTIQRLRPGIVKIDGKYFAESHSKNNIDAILETVKHAKSLKATICAEHIETRKMLEWASNIGCHLAQGFLFQQDGSIVSSGSEEEAGQKIK